MYDVAVIGAGAAGLSLSVMLKRAVPSLSVTLFEAGDRVGRKLAVTGNGRCNITNLNTSADRYHGDAEFASRLLNGFPYSEQKAFFSEIGIIFTTLEEGKVYPMSLQATSVVDALRFKAEELGVKTVIKAPVGDIKRRDGGFSFTACGKQETCRVLVIATGGQAGGKLGSTDGYAMLKTMGHKIETVFPSLVQLKTAPEVVRQLKGIKIMAMVTAVSSVGTRSEYGEVLFCDYGLSGPPILQVSRLGNGDNMTVSLDIVPDMTEAEIKSELLHRKEIFAGRSMAELFTGFLHKRLGQIILKCVGVDLNSDCEALNEQAAARSAEILKDWRFKVTGTTGFENAQVTAGGAQTAQFFDTCMSKKAKGLFAVGEVLNVDGDCGGFNLAFAWASAHAAADGIKEYLNL